MSIAGETILTRLEEEAAALRSEATDAEDRRAEAIAERTRLDETREDVLVSLARTSLPNLDAASIEASHAEIRRQLRDLADRRRRSETELADRKTRLEAEFHSHSGDFEAATAAAEAAADAFDERRRELEASLAGDEGYTATMAATDAARVRLERDERRLAEVEREAAEKRPAFENSPLFTFLRDRHFGTADYAGSLLTRRLDVAVARHIDYATLAESYRFLVDAPPLMRSELERRRADLDGQVDTALARVHAAEATFGLGPLQEDVNAAEQQLGRLRDARERLIEQLDTVETQLADVRSNEGRFYAEALKSLAEYLDGLETSVLEDRAAGTPGAADDDAVAELRRLREAETAAASRLTDAEAQTRRQSELADGLDAVLRRARQSELDSDRAEFPESFDLEGPLRQYRKGIIDRRRLAEIIKDAATLRPTWAERAYRRGGDLASSPAAQVLLGTAAAAGRKAIEEAMRRRR